MVDSDMYLDKYTRRTYTTSAQPELLDGRLLYGTALVAKADTSLSVSVGGRGIVVGSGRGSVAGHCCRYCIVSRRPLDGDGSSCWL